MRSLIPRTAKRTFCLALICALALLVSPAAAGCLVDAGLLRQSLNCTGMPTIDKFFDPVTFSWKGKDYLTVNDGNELELWDVTDPAHPIAKGQSNMNVDNMGDSDYDLLNYSVCDDCRFGVGVWKLGTVVFDLGTGPNPTWSARKFYGTSRDPRGAFTYEHGGSQYLVGMYLPQDMGGEGTLYKVVTPTQLTPIHKVDVPGTLKITNGIKMDGHVYLGMTDNYLYSFTLNGESLVYMNKTPIRGFMLRGKSISRNGDRMVSAFMDGVRLWDVRNPAVPTLTWTMAGDYRLAALTRNFAWFSNASGVKSTYHLPEGREPVKMDQEFWDNLPTYSGCDSDQGATFSNDGKWLWLTRYATVQKVDLSCCPPVEVLFADGFESGTMSAWAVMP